MRNRLLCAAFAVCAALAPAGAIPAQADTGPRQAASTLALTITPGEQASLDGKKTALSCDPAGGQHPHANMACAELTRVDGDFDALSVHPNQMCMWLYKPVTVTADGSWHARAVHYRKTYGNDCQLEAATGPVFRF